MRKFFIGYYRVSRESQGLGNGQGTGYGIDAQTRLVENHVANVGGELIATYTEVESGKKCNRPQALSAIAHCKRSGAILIMSKTDRLLRNMKFLVMLREAEIEFICLDNPSCDKFTLTVLCAVAEKERDDCSYRTRMGLQSAKAKGVQLGSPCIKVAQERAVSVLKSNSVAFAQSVYPVILEAKADRKGRWKTLNDFGQYLKIKNVRTARGLADWTPSSVANVIRICESQPLTVKTPENQ
jgi:DNA invertase Pin-like site-specific DNA recombinase